MLKKMLIALGMIWGRWLDALGSVLLASREMWRARRPLIVSFNDNQIIIRQANTDRATEPAIIKLRLIIAAFCRAVGRRNLGFQRKIHRQSEVLAVLPRGRRVPDEVARAAMAGLVNLELPRDRIVMRRISVPNRAREFLAGIVCNQIERLSPWPFEQVLHGFDVNPNADDPAGLDVRVFITSRAAANTAREEIEAIGLTVDRVLVHENDTPVVLWSQIANPSLERTGRVRQMIGSAISVLAAASVFISLWAFSSASSLRAESEEMMIRSKTIQRQLQGLHSDGSLPAQQRAWVSKETSPSAVVVLEALSRTLPDSAYLTELRLENVTLRIIGFAEDVPSLIAPLEQSGHFVDVRFFAPTTRSPDGNLFRFNIESRMVPRINITEK